MSRENKLINEERHYYVRLRIMIYGQVQVPGQGQCQGELPGM